MRSYLSPGITEHPCDGWVIRQRLNQRKSNIANRRAMSPQGFVTMALRAHRLGSVGKTFY
ncbi:hypothetical protein GGQ67_002998 [Rhizobium metallidurans]|uniref:Uncharacterized protein n=1 Tax=Rhizobium metallidurans TaxID=1265931 RepID=A0A7W6CQF6_9HYPH|nr:hypothetical protein [Rhizobium metallidurans]